MKREEKSQGDRLNNQSPDGVRLMGRYVFPEIIFFHQIPVFSHPFIHQGYAFGIGLPQTGYHADHLLVAVEFVEERSPGHFAQTPEPFAINNPEIHHGIINIQPGYLNHVGLDIFPDPFIQLTKGLAGIVTVHFLQVGNGDRIAIADGEPPADIIVMGIVDTGGNDLEAKLKITFIFGLKGYTG